MYCLTSICYVCLKMKNKSLINIKSTLSVHKDILRIIGYLPCNLAWLKTNKVVLICNECCVRLRDTDKFLSTCSRNSEVLQGYIDKLNTESVSNADKQGELRVDCNTGRDGKSEIKLERKEETGDALVNVKDGFVKPCSAFKMVDTAVDSPLRNNSIENGHQQYRNSGAGVMGRGKKRTKGDGSGNKDEDTSGGSQRVKKTKKNTKGTVDSYTGNGAGKESPGKEAVVETAVCAGKERPGGPVVVRVKSVKDLLTKQALERYLQEEKQQQEQQQGQEQLEAQQQEQQQQAQHRPEQVQKAQLQKAQHRQEQVQQEQQQLEQQLQQEQQQQRQEQQQQQAQHEKQMQRKPTVAFRELLSEAHLHGKSTYSAFKHAYGHDVRFKNVLKEASRVGMFNQHIAEVRRRETEPGESQRHAQGPPQQGPQQQQVQQLLLLVHQMLQHAYHSNQWNLNWQQLYTQWLWWQRYYNG